MISLLCGSHPKVILDQTHPYHLLHNLLLRFGRDLLPVLQEQEKGEGVHGNGLPLNFNPLPLRLIWREASIKQIPLCKEVDNCCPVLKHQKSKAEFVGNWPQPAVSLNLKAKEGGLNLLYLLEGVWNQNEHDPHLASVSRLAIIFRQELVLLTLISAS